MCHRLSGHYGQQGFGRPPTHLTGRHVHGGQAGGNLRRQVEIVETDDRQAFWHGNTARLAFEQGTDSEHVVTAENSCCFRRLVEQDPQALPPSSNP